MQHGDQQSLMNGLLGLSFSRLEICV